MSAKTKFIICTQNLKRPILLCLYLKKKCSYGITKSYVTKNKVCVFSKLNSQKL